MQHAKPVQDTLVQKLTTVGTKVLRIVQKYKDTQLDFFDQVRVFDARQRDAVPKEMSKYPA